MDVADQPESQGFSLACARLTPTGICGRRIRGLLETPEWRQRIIYSKNPVPPDAKGFWESGFPWAGAQGLLLESADFSTRSDRNNPLRPRFAGVHPPQEGNFVPLTCRGFGESGQAAVGVDHPAKRRLQGFPIERRSRGSI